MKNFLSSFIFVSSLTSCSSPSSPHEISDTRLEEINHFNEYVLDSIEEEPQRQGIKEIQKEGIITTEIWRMKTGHGGNVVTETIIFKNNEMISHSLRDPERGVTASRQFRDGKVIQLSEEKPDGTNLTFLNSSGQIEAQLFYGSNQECVLYDHGENPRFEKVSVCEEKYNYAP